MITTALMNTKSLATGYEGAHEYSYTVAVKLVSVLTVSEGALRTPTQPRHFQVAERSHYRDHLAHQNRASRTHDPRLCLDFHYFNVIGPAGFCGGFSIFHLPLHFLLDPPKWMLFFATPPQLRGESGVQARIPK